MCCHRVIAGAHNLELLAVVRGVVDLALAEAAVPTVLTWQHREGRGDSRDGAETGQTGGEACESLRQHHCSGRAPMQSGHECHNKMGRGRFLGCRARGPPLAGRRRGESGCRGAARLVHPRPHSCRSSPRSPRGTRPSCTRARPWPSRPRPTPCTWTASRRTSRRTCLGAGGRCVPAAPRTLRAQPPARARWRWAHRCWDTRGTRWGIAQRRCRCAAVVSRERLWAATTRCMASAVEGRRRMVCRCAGMHERQHTNYPI